jgi:hypothetical protein
MLYVFELMADATELMANATNEQRISVPNQGT